MARVRLSVATTDWTLRGLPLRGATSGAGRRSASEGIDPFAARLAASGRVEVAAAGVAIPSVRRDREPRRALEIDVEAGRGERVVFMARHPSGAITFHLPSESPRRGARGTARHRFQLPAAAPERRGVVAAGVKFVLLKVADAVAGAALPALARAVETRLWKSRGLVDGWVRVPLDGTWRGPFVALPKGGGSFAAPPKKNLLLVHGIFSNAEAAFAGLATTRGSNGRTFFEQTAALYEGRVFAFNHLTVSRDPAENARALLSSLPPGPTLFDVVTHSRGGVVFRSVIERPDLHGDLARRFRPGRAVLVAAPNEGSPLAAPERLGDLLGWLANVIDYLPDNPFTTGLALVAEGLSWLASNVPGRLPGIAALAPSSAEIAAIQAAPHPAPESLSALVANYEPDDGLAARMADAAVDAFFASANDLVVPSEGGWRLARGLSVPPGQIGCFGPGGNIAGGPGKVHHVNFFAQPAAVDFVSRGLGGAPQGLAPVEPERRLPFREGRRGAQGGSFTATPRPDRGERSAPPADVAIPVVASPDPDRRGSFGETFELTVLDGEPGRRDLRLLAKFRNATRLERVVRGGPGDPLAKIRKTQKEIRAFVDGEKGAPDLPRGRALVDLGTRLFDALFPGEIRRLYDVARAFQHPRRLNVILTSTVDEIADLPWEFAYDSSRKAFVAAEEVNFVRNVETAVPADRIAPRAGPLRILVVVAQPLGTSHLSADAETEVIRSGFRRLLEARLAEVDVLLEATPDALHRALEAEVRPIDVLHFIGHGAFEERKGTAQDPGVGYLLFEDENRRIERLDAPTFRQIVAQRGIRLVFLNACESGRGGITDFNRGVAPDLVAAGVPTVVANQFSVLDTAATSFARHFYWSLAIGHTVGDAAREARVSVNASISGEALDWAVPVLFAQDPSDRLVARRAEDVASLSPVRAAATRRRPAPDRRHLAVWDVQRLFPDLERIARELTEAQDQFVVEAVSFSAPLGTWRREKGGGVAHRKYGETAYLWAERVAERLKDKPDELGVDRLLCITNVPLRSRRVLGIFAWDEDPDERISIFSTADLLDQLRPPELSLDLLIANAVVWIFSGLEAHDAGPKACPLFYNDERDIRYIAGPLQFCARDRAKLRGEPKKRAALEKLLALYAR